jgi:glycine/D-amino acid oxidase-like deaminating enzyme
MRELPGAGHNGGVSFWHAELGGLPAPRARLEGDATADVCIVGAGYTGLWTAHYLRRLDPGLSIIVLEREVAGFGASGRNGGWLTGAFAWNHARYMAAEGGREGVRRMIRALALTPREVMEEAARLGIAADILPCDEITVATTPAQMARIEAEAATRAAFDVAEDRIRLIGAAEARGRIDIPGLRGALLTAGVARIQPARLVRGLARAVEGAGVRICEGTEVRAIAPGRVTTAHGIVRAPVILRATEGFTARLPGHRRDWLPLNSAQIVTEPLPAAVWERIGWAGHELVGNAANLYFYAQRTREGRIAFGGRGQPYRFGSGIDDNGEAGQATIAWLVEGLRRHFPAAAGARIDHAWCGVLGVPRDWCASVGFDRASGIGWAGGYVGVGVATSNLAARSLADLVLGRESELAALPWVNRRPRRWEPEPLRWLAVRGMYALLAAADRREARPGAGESRLAAIGRRLAGR